MDICILNHKVVFPWLRSAFVKCLMDNLDAKKRKETDLSKSIRTATNFFDPIIYKRKIRVDPGKLLHLATCLHVKNLKVVTPDSSTLSHKPSFNLKMTSKVAPEIEWPSVVSQLKSQGASNGNSRCLSIIVGLSFY